MGIPIDQAVENAINLQAQISQKLKHLENTALSRLPALFSEFVLESEGVIVDPGQWYLYQDTYTNYHRVRYERCVEFGKPQVEYRWPVSAWSDEVLILYDEDAHLPESSWIISDLSGIDAYFNTLVDALVHIKTQEDN